MHAVVAELESFENDTLTFRPLLMGGPWLLPPPGEPDPLPGAEWFSQDYFEVFAEDIDELTAPCLNPTVLEDPGRPPSRVVSHQANGATGVPGTAELAIPLAIYVPSRSPIRQHPRDRKPRHLG